MFFGDFITQMSIAILSGYLAISGALAQVLEARLVAWHLMEPRSLVTSPLSEEDIREPLATSPDTLPSEYERGGPIPRILLENLEYQQAAVAGAGSGRAKDRAEKRRVEDALVNIFCAYRDGNQVRATTGSGAFIDEKGIVLTNAHVAQFLLIPEFKQQARCTIRQGDPAKDRYVADLLYISPAWVHKNAALIDDISPSGTGERDFALLYVTEGIDGEAPSTFPSLAFDVSNLAPSMRQEEVRAAGYPAEIFREEGPRADLVPRVSATKLIDLFTFGGGEADLISIGNSAVGEQGASGGPILSQEGAVIGLIVTKGDPVKEGEHSLRAITLAYINRTLKEDTGFDLATTLEGNIPRRAEIFQNALVPFLSALLKSELQ